MMPSQDMVLGCYYLTTNLLNKKTGLAVGSTLTNLMGSGLYYSNREEALRDYDLKKLIYILISG
jgi:DNA-directed RNA polymerase beta' subunit